MINKLKVAVLVAMLSVAGALTVPAASAVESDDCWFYWSHNGSHKYVSRSGGSFVHTGPHRWDDCNGSKGFGHYHQIHEH